MHGQRHCAKNTERNWGITMRVRIEKKLPRFIKQRIRWGFDERELWSLFMTIAKFVLPRLQRLKTILHGCPQVFCMKGEKDMGVDYGMKVWNRELDKMIRAFEIIIEEDDYPMEKKKIKEVEEGMDSFRKHFFSLWD